LAAAFRKGLSEAAMSRGRTLHSVQLQFRGDHHENSTSRPDSGDRRRFALGCGRCLAGRHRIPPFLSIGRSFGLSCSRSKYRSNPRPSSRKSPRMDSTALTRRVRRRLEVAFGDRQPEELPMSPPFSCGAPEQPSRDGSRHGAPHATLSPPRLGGPGGHWRDPPSITVKLATALWRMGDSLSGRHNR
jgi:hypothetical protein